LPAEPVVPAVPGPFPAEPVVPADPGPFPAEPVVPADPGPFPAEPVVPPLPVGIVLAPLPQEAAAKKRAPPITKSERFMVVPPVVRRSAMRNGERAETITRAGKIRNPREMQATLPGGGH
jgi:hypothetical protein